MGAGWSNHVDGRRLRALGDAFRRKLDTTALYEDWLRQIQAAPSFEVSGRVFRLVAPAAGGGGGEEKKKQGDDACRLTPV